MAKGMSRKNLKLVARDNPQTDKKIRIVYPMDETRFFVQNPTVEQGVPLVVWSAGNRAPTVAMSQGSASREIDLTDNAHDPNYSRLCRWLYRLRIPGSTPNCTITVTHDDGREHDECIIHFGDNYNPTVNLVEPTASDHVSGPFTAYGYCTPGSCSVSAWIYKRPNDGTTVATGTKMTPPMPPFNWCFQFPSLANGTYTLWVSVTDGGPPVTANADFDVP